MEKDDQQKRPVQYERQTPPAPGEYDLPDSERDKQRLQPDHATMDLPEVKDIPGQEHITVMPLGELSDTTASSDDEEGTEPLGD